MTVIVDWLNSQAFAVAGQSFAVVEVVGFVTGALCVWAVTRQFTWNWPVGIANNIVFLVLFLGAGLYADSALQIAFAAVGAYGWWKWRRGDVAPATLPVRRARAAEAVGGVLAVGVGTVVVAQLLNVHTDSTVPWPDAFILTASLLATWGQARKILEQWWVWITVDVVSIPLYAHKGLWLTAVLYTGFLALCIDGLRRWRTDFADQTAADEKVAA
ncbi:MAG: nicotinamide mononucleotide transporter [Gordonia sp.]|uniref:nicotinamide riboside transporter PnuC n=1 Tax=Gordonia sp. (in: high G+C Gram-positive bacteria) TaxID=84139 RepID=UPI001DA098E2|nr:nicotinamide riboside transporter PnuC [Gordonia sp. (in: high G+C Gram-positive bacteria)]MCB1295280.1 nicotinamide mononucleotide transporter [Gordonia sp. (in: high G+C Gram-positive bacteria)]